MNEKLFVFNNGNHFPKGPHGAQGIIGSKGNAGHRGQKVFFTQLSKYPSSTLHVLLINSFLSIYIQVCVFVQGQPGDPGITGEPGPLGPRGPPVR